MALSVASADTTSTTVRASTIPRSVFRQERLAAAAEVLQTATDEIDFVHRDKSCSTLISQAGLTKQTYGQN